jgi:hypothetical protein
MKKYPIRFDRLEVGSKFKIFAEPSRGIRRSSDGVEYTKETQSWSSGGGKDIILMPSDLVTPISRPRKV